MTKTDSPLWRIALAAAAVTTAVAVAACGADPADPAAPAASGTHSAHAGAAPPLPLRAGERFVDLSMSEAYTPAPPEGGGTDEYRCQVIDPKLTSKAFLTGTQFIPENVAIAHHAIVFALPPGSEAKVRATDEKTPGLGWTCFGGPDIQGGQQAAWVDTWTPGATETLLTQDAGYELAPGSLLVLQIHYNLLATDGKPAGSDRSAVRLRLTDGTPQTRKLNTWPIDAPTELPCAADESGPLCDRAASIADIAKRFGPEVGSAADQLLKGCGQNAPKPGDTQSCDHKVPAPMTLFAAYGHMHLLGRAMKVELNPGTPNAKVLLDVPAFDFDAQRLQTLPAPVDIGPGDTLRLTCTHDASLRKRLPQLSKLPPRYVVWGDGTSDEMCLAPLTVARRSA